MSSTFPLSPQFTTGQTVTAADLDAATTTRMNDLYAQVADDTGWVTITPASGYKAGGFTTDGPQYRVFHGVVYFQGYIQPNSGSFTASASDIVIAAAGAIPSTARGSTVPLQRVVSANGIANIAIAWVGTDGSINLKTGSTAPAYISVASLGPYPAS